MDDSKDLADGAITFSAIFYRATTTVDGGWRVSFDINPNDADKIAALAEHRDDMFQVAAIPVGSAMIDELN